MMIVIIIMMMMIITMMMIIMMMMIMMMIIMMMMRTEKLIMMRYVCNCGYHGSAAALIGMGLRMGLRIYAKQGLLPSGPPQRSSVIFPSVKELWEISRLTREVRFPNMNLGVKTMSRVLNQGSPDGDDDVTRG